VRAVRGADARRDERAVRARVFGAERSWRIVTNFLKKTIIQKKKNLIFYLSFT